MKLRLADPRALLFEGDCAELPAHLPPGSVDSIVTDPPAGIGFMGRDWDSDKGGREQWVAWLAQVLSGARELLKPGGHALVWALPRTAHWTMTALEDAGFEVRDVVSHLFGTGFPKSLDVSKAIDKAAGAVRPVVGFDEVKAKQQTSKSGTSALGDFAGSSGEITGAATAAAAAWEGWGTALKPAAEFWILARKPLDRTVAHNVITHGTGALNIDGCRIGSDVVGWGGGGRGSDGGTWNSETTGLKAGEARPAEGRFPAHVVLSHTDACFEIEPDRFACVPDCAVRMLDDQSGNRKSSKGIRERGKDNTVYGQATDKPFVSYGDEGGASRFFYTAKVSRAERDHGCEHLEHKSGAEVTDREEGSAGLNSPRAGAGRGKGARNHHPTVKPQALMRWLVRLITPPGGTVLDLFAGSGSTAVAALAEGCSFIGVELSPEYLPIAEARLRRALADFPPPEQEQKAS